MKYYCIGIKGTGMSTLAQILNDLGNEVTGYDDVSDYKFTQKGLDERNIKIYYDNEHEIDKDTIVTYSVAFSLDHPELKRVRELGLTIKKYNEIVGDITKMFDTISVSGTHGKTTTSSLIKHIIDNTFGCNYFIGAGDGKVNLDKNVFVIESDEFNKHFLTYYPTNAIITNIEEEHMECYNDLQDIIYTFSLFVSHTKNDVVACGDNLNVRNIKTDKNIIYYGFNDNNEYVIKNDSVSEEGSSFSLYHNNELIDNFTVPLYGKHMILDTTAAIIMCIKYNVSLDKIKENLKTFKNAKRRFAEEKINDVVIIDDYAHHPTEIRETLKACRNKYPNKRLVAVFKPNTYSRTKDFTKDFIESLSIADKVYLTEIDSNREKQEDYPRVSSHMITDNIENSEIISDEEIGNLANEKDAVVCFMSCATISHLIDNYKKVI